MWALIRGLVIKYESNLNLFHRDGGRDNSIEQEQTPELICFGRKLQNL